MNLFQQYLQEALTHLISERFRPGLAALRQALLLRPLSRTAHRALLTCSFALDRAPDALYHGHLCDRLTGDWSDASFYALLGRAGIAYAEMLARLGIAEAAEVHQGALNHLRDAYTLAGEAPLLKALLHVEESLPVQITPVAKEPLPLYYHDPFITWTGPTNRREYLLRLEERCRREGYLICYASRDLDAGTLRLEHPLIEVCELTDLPIHQVWEITSPLGLEEGRPLRTLTFIEGADGQMQILVEPWLARHGARREIQLAWDAANTFAA